MGRPSGEHKELDRAVSILHGVAETACPASPLHKQLCDQTCMPRSYQHEYTRSRPISEVKHVWARLVLR